ncbi:shikimate dehydrogenase [Mammaliicoccus vitulinus]|uniref:shikimate dehydrogenase n=1 Tax=Mammaliicoccus vitulinus TaxID=71237 RepID=UPI000D1D1ED0|nr:shikimate dehydrogenase [Mammaliicoccus vitulinus]PTI89336.1 shikimate dehydrogenase [Mammaliicoccus vitulinus]
MKFGVIGHPIDHSLSPIMHSANFEALGRDDQYHALNVPPQHFQRIREIIKEQEFNGFNITIPHKESIIPYLDEISPSAQYIGAVNTVLVKDDKWIGYNTDGIGFVKGLIDKHGPIDENNILVLGAGGASKGIVSEMIKFTNHKITVANRSVDRFDNWQLEIKAMSLMEVKPLIHTFDMIINTTPVGMNEKSSELIIPIEKISKKALVCDIIYIPNKTPLLQACEREGLAIYNGLDMFVYQGAESFEIWTGQEANIEVMKNRVKDELKRR